MSAYQRVCRLCGSAKYVYNEWKRRYRCGACYAESRRDFSVSTRIPRKPTETDALGDEPNPDLTIDGYMDEHGYRQEIFYLCRKLPRRLTPKRFMNIEYAEFIKHLRRHDIAENTRHAARELKRRGFRRTKKKMFLHGEWKYVWYTDEDADFFEGE